MLARKSMISFFWTHTFFGTHPFFSHIVSPEKVWVPFFVELILFLGALTFSTQCLARKNATSLFDGTHTFLVEWLAWTCMNFCFFVRNCKIFLGLRFFDEINVGNSQRSLFSRTLTLNTFVVELCFCCCECSEWFHFIEILFFRNLFFWPTRDICCLRTLGCSSKTTFASEL